MDFKLVQKEIELQSRGWIPTFHDISKEVLDIVAASGVYNAWRTVLFSVAAAGMSYLVGALLGKIPTVLLLILCAGGYLVCAVWYYFATRRFIQKRE